MRTTYQTPLDGSKGMKPVEDESPMLCGVFATHTPPLHLSAAEHGIVPPQLPQLVTELTSFSHPSFALPALQSAYPPVHAIEHAPFTHEGVPLAVEQTTRMLQA